MAFVEAPCTPADAVCQPSTSGVKPSNTVAPIDVHILLVDDERLSRVVVGNLLRNALTKVCHVVPDILMNLFARFDMEIYFTPFNCVQSAKT